ncbi:MULTISPECIES: hypothetical protein [Bacillus]|uniref:Uncharacterized protein n=1 Tax=Bacillus fungorum TaxID=2039284 RepID=A0A2G6Q8N5_9BACI|nr:MULTISPECIES: hypothetical protein [Bacillus]MDA2637450.1 hypothetical protein [Bacillus cereus]PEQ98490.1 hypothetical protein CN477_26240 [Bacillus cereus]PIE92750.1 hypothetical protein CO726_24595 [Bacillus fungorum]
MQAINLPQRYKKAFEEAKRKGFNLIRMTAQERKAYEWYKREVRLHNEHHKTKKTVKNTRKQADFSRKSGKVVTKTLDKDELKELLDSQNNKLNKSNMTNARTRQ